MFLFEVDSFFPMNKGGAFQPLPSESLPHLSSLLSADPDPFLYGDVPKDPKINAIRIYEDYVDRQNKTNG